MTDTRKLAYTVTIDSLQPIEGADRVEIAMVGGWQVVVQKGLYKPGDTAVYFEVDSLLPTDNPAFASLTSLSSKLLFEINGKGYARIKTAKIRKQLSQGYLTPVFDLLGSGDVVLMGADLTAKLGVLKYEGGEERRMNNGDTATNSGVGTRSFPDFIPKTDQNRVQNIVPRYNQSRDNGEMFEKTYKLDGSSMTAYQKDGEQGVCSRNVGFKLTETPKGFKRTLKDFIKQVKKHGFKRAKWEPMLPPANNAFVQMAKNAGLLAALKLEGRNLAIQGEMVGPKIQQNFEGVDSNQFYIYDIYDIDNQQYFLPEARQEFARRYDLKHVPIAGMVKLPDTVADCINDADGKSGLNGKYREGFVYKALTRDFSFKVISNSYLLKEK